jgi:hypothetical protein
MRQADLFGPPAPANGFRVAALAVGSTPLDTLIDEAIEAGHRELGIELAGGGVWSFTDAPDPERLRRILHLQIERVRFWRRVSGEPERIARVEAACWQAWRAWRSLGVQAPLDMSNPPLDRREAA